MQIDTYLAGLPVFGMRVLIAEDEPFHCEVLQRMLTVLGFRDVAMATNGMEALNIASKDPFHLVITDMDMPEMDGIHLTGELRKLDDLAQIPIIMLTCHRNAEDITRAKQAGVSHYIGKPFDIVTLKDKILQSYADKSPNIFGKNQLKAAKKAIH